MDQIVNLAMFTTHRTVTQSQTALQGGRCITVRPPGGRSSITDFWQASGYRPAAPVCEVWRGLTRRRECDTVFTLYYNWLFNRFDKKTKGSPYSITERRVPELIPVVGSQPAGDVSHKPSGRLPLLSARPALTPATLKRVATNFAAW